jgi:putative ABC transport system permease protein
VGPRLAATDGFHVSAAYYRDRDVDRADVELDTARARLAELADAPEVRAVGGPWTHLYGLLDVDGGSEDLTAEIREPGRSLVDQPLVTAGSWLSAGSDGVVLEHGLADTLEAGPGDMINVQGHEVAVRGVAMTVSRGRFPLSRPAQIWVTPRTGETLRRIGLTEEGLEMQLRLQDPDDAEAFATAHEGIEARGETSTLFLDTWRRRRADSHSDIDILAGTVFAAGTLVGLLTVATAAVIVAGRMAAQTRQIGTLKAVGVTPRQVVLALLVENLALAGLATLVGLGAGRILAPRLAEASQTVLGQPEMPALTWGRAAILAGVAAAVVVLATVRPAVRGLRHSTVRSLASGARPPRRPGHRSRWAATTGLPLVALLGLRSARRRPARLLTNAVGLSLAVAMIVVAAGLRPSLARLAAEDSAPAPPGEALSAGAVDDLYEQVRAIVLGTAGLLLVLATINALIIVTLAARDSARNHATLRVVGATPRQTTAIWSSPRWARAYWRSPWAFRSAWACGVSWTAVTSRRSRSPPAHSWRSQRSSRWVSPHWSRSRPVAGPTDRPPASSPTSDGRRAAICQPAARFRQPHAGSARSDGSRDERFRMIGPAEVGQHDGPIFGRDVLHGVDGRGRIELPREVELLQTDVQGLEGDASSPGLVEHAR